MRLFAKIVIFTTLILSVAILFSGYLLIKTSYEVSVRRETEWALTQYQYDKFTVQSGLVSFLQSGEMPKNDSEFRYLTADLNKPIAIFSENRALLFSNLSFEMDIAIVADADDNTIAHEIQKNGEKSYIMICGKVTQNNQSLYLLTASDITPTVTQKEYMVNSFGKVYAITLALSMALILILSAIITRPIKKLTKAATKIAGGEYNGRLVSSSGDEIGELSDSFNKMTDAINDKMNELALNARQKEDFVANFAHELKTPLTSVIGYADMLYQKRLPPEDVKNAAWYILNEGLRLESLSLKLMDLIVLSRQDFTLEAMPADELLQDAVGGLKPLFEKKEVTSRLEADLAFIKVDYDLIKTLILNLIDNSIKADCSEVFISGKRNGNHYLISVTDNGRGIPAGEIDRITEAFYMVDKSRARKQHGAGLGLSLAVKIAEIHGGTLRFRNNEKTHGTIVELELICQEVESDE